MLFRQIFDPKLAQYAYLIGCQQTKEALVVDPERDIDVYLELAEREGLEITAVAETHIHADFLSGAREFAERFGTRLYLSDEGDDDWKYEWARAGRYDATFLHDGDTFTIGNIELKTVHTPGHTPEHVSFLVTDHGGGADEPMGIVTGDFVFVGDLGRPDLLESAAGVEGMMEPSARRLYASAQRFLELPDFLQVWPAHGAGSACGKALGAVPESTVGYEKRFNAALAYARRGEQAFVDEILAGQPEPPLYFARMKRDNRRGPNVLGRLPQPRRLTPAELGDLAGRTDVAVLDTRLNRQAFMAGHLPGALYAPLNKQFNTTAGSYVEEDTPVYLIVDEDHVEEAVRDLIRIGLDEVVGYAAPETLEHFRENDGELACIQQIDFDDVAELKDRPNLHVVDVRRAGEYASAHIPDAQHLPHTRLLERHAELPDDRTLMVHCASGARSAVASALLARLGYDVLYVDDAFEHWTVRNETESAQAGAEA